MRRISMGRWSVFGVALVGIAGAVGDAVACPSCPTARLVRAAVCGQELWPNLAAVVAPFAVLGVVTWRLHGIGRHRPPGPPEISA